MDIVLMSTSRRIGGIHAYSMSHCKQWDGHYEYIFTIDVCTHYCLSYALLQAEYIYIYIYYIYIYIYCKYCKCADWKPMTIVSFSVMKLLSIIALSEPATIN